MAKFTSKYKSLGFYVKGTLKQFENGAYETKNKAEIEALKNVKEATLIEEDEGEKNGDTKGSEA